MEKHPPVVTQYFSRVRHSLVFLVGDSFVSRDEYGTIVHVNE